MRIEFWFTASLTIGAAVLYLTGYGFLTGYFNHFNIFLPELDLSAEDFFVHSFSALGILIKRSSGFWNWATLWVFTVLIAVAIYPITKTRRFYVRALVVSFCFACTLPPAALAFYLPITASSLGNETAAEQMLILNVSELPTSSALELQEIIDQTHLVRVFSIYNTQSYGYFLHVPDTAASPWMVRVRWEDSTFTRYYLD